MKNPEKLLEEIKSATLNTIGDNLVGIYVHGSYAFGCFNWNMSDIDYIVVIKKPLALDEKIEYISKILTINDKCPPKGIEMSVVLEKNCRNISHPVPYELHFSNSHLERVKADINDYCKTMNGNDPDLAAHFTVTRTVGIVLYGKKINDVFSPVPEEYYLDSIKYDIENAMEDILENPVYVILNLCRTVAYIREKLVISKADGGEWGMRNLPENYNTLVKNALSCYLSEDNYPITEYKNELENFANYMLQQIKGRY